MHTCARLLARSLTQPPTRTCEAAGNSRQIQALFDNGVFEVLISMIASAEWDVRKEAAWAISNSTSGESTPAQIRSLIKLGCVLPLCSLLKVLWERGQVILFSHGAHPITLLRQRVENP